jgi:hypothetical protein
MTSVRRSIVELASRLLERQEREVVLGDLAESRERTWEALSNVCGSVIRRQTQLWKSWEPWLAGFGVTLPSSFLLMGVSVSVSWSYQRLLCPNLLHEASLTPGSGLVVLLWQALLLLGWAWSGGFLVGSTSRRTLWASALLCVSRACSALSRFRIGALSRFCLLLFLVPAAWGVVQGLKGLKLRMAPALTVASVVTILMVPVLNAGVHQWWVVPKIRMNWILSLPAWYLVASARRSSEIAVRN